MALYLNVNAIRTHGLACIMVWSELAHLPWLGTIYTITALLYVYSNNNKRGYEGDINLYVGVVGDGLEGHQRIERGTRGSER